MSHLEDELERRTLTYTSWNQSIDTKDKRSWHPKTFEFPDANLEQIMEIRVSIIYCSYLHIIVHTSPHNLWILYEQFIIVQCIFLNFLYVRKVYFFTLQNINHVYYETEYRTEWCQCNATFVPCFLFARKFSRSAAMRILNEGLLGPFDAGAFLFTNS